MTAMTLSQDELMSLMAYVDGELDPSELDAVEALLAKNEDARSLVAELGATGDWVRAASDATAVAAGADKIVDRVMADVAALKDRPHESSVVSLSSARARRATSTRRVMQVGALAAAAAILVIVWSFRGLWKQDVAINGPGTDPSASPMPRPPEKKGPERVLVQNEPTETLIVGSADGVDIENLESPNQVSVFYLPVMNKSAASVVVWIGESEEKTP